MELKELGLNNWFLEKLETVQRHEFHLARVIAVNKDNYIIRNEESETLAEITGKIIYGAESPLDFPTVGDWVYVQYFDNNTFAIIHEIFPRKSVLKRKVSGKKIDYQLIASNIDIAFIIQSADTDFNKRRLERYLVMVNESNIKPVILLSKRDLVSSKILKQEVSEIRSMNHKYEIIAFSNKTGEGLKKVQSLIKPGITYCLLGSSGVGKTTLLNRLIGQNIYVTNAVREKDGKGKHTTVRRELTILEKGGLIIDSPGMRELGNIGVGTGLKETFADINVLAQGCRFKNCTHINEPGCSVLKALEEGELNDELYQSYLKLRKESEHFEMSYLEKRKRDKKLGKMYKEIIKNKKNR